VFRIEAAPDHPLSHAEYPGSVPAVAQLLEDGLDLGPLTVLVGENGSGKSTIIEAVAMAFGMAPEGGSTGSRHASRGSESDLWRGIRLRRGIGASRWGFFLRAETMHGFYTYLEENPQDRGRLEPRFHEMSHGQSFLAMLSSRFVGSGLYLLDEPESALSFQSSLHLVAVLADLARTATAQVMVATHSPVVAATPGATILQLDDQGLRPTDWEDLDLVTHHRGFLEHPQRYLRHLT